MLVLIIIDFILIVSKRPTFSDLGYLWVLGAKRFSRIPSFIIKVLYSFLKVFSLLK